MKKDEKQFQQFPNVSIVWKPTKGRTARANIDLPKGSTIFRCAPFASTIEDSDKLATEKYCGMPEQLKSVFNSDASDFEELQQIIEISEQLKNSKISSPQELQRVKDKILSLINPTIYNSFKDKRLLI
ncbi:hypothetical protein ACTFIZ_003241 [Dictyostelium cf. discoideum]